MSTTTQNQSTNLSNSHSLEDNCLHQDNNDDSPDSVSFLNEEQNSSPINELTYAPHDNSSNDGNTNSLEIKPFEDKTNNSLTGTIKKNRDSNKQGETAQQDDEEEPMSFVYPSALSPKDDQNQNSKTDLSLNATTFSPLSSNDSPPLQSPLPDDDAKDLQHNPEEFNMDLSIKSLSSPTKNQYNGRRHSMEDLISPNPNQSASLNETLSNKRGYYKTYTREQLMKALEAVQTAKMSGEQAAKFFKVPRSTLHHHLRPMQYWCVYCQKDLRYKIEWKEHMATHKKKSSTSQPKVSKPNHLLDIKDSKELNTKDTISLANGNHYPNNDQANHWPTAQFDDYITSTNGLSMNQKHLPHINEPQLYHYQQGTSKSDTSTNSLINVNAEGDNTEKLGNHFAVNNITLSRSHRAVKNNDPPKMANKMSEKEGNAINYYVSRLASMTNNKNAIESSSPCHTKTSDSMPLITTNAGNLYQGLANGSVPTLTDYLSGLTRVCPEGIDPMKYLSDYYYHNYYQQYEALNKCKRMSESLINSKLDTDTYGDLGKDVYDNKGHTIASNKFSCDTLRDYLLQGKVTTASSSDWDKINRSDKNRIDLLYEDKKSEPIKSKNEKIVKSHDLTSTSSNCYPNMPNELRRLMLKTQSDQNSSPNIEYVCALCAITSSNKAQFLNHLFLHNQIFLISNVNGTSCSDPEKPDLKELNLALQKTATHITRKLDSLYKNDQTNESWSSILTSIVQENDQNHLSMDLKKNDEYPIKNKTDNKVVDRFQLNAAPKKKDTYIVPNSTNGSLGIASNIVVTDYESSRIYPHWFKANLPHYFNGSFIKNEQEETALSALYNLSNLNQSSAMKFDKNTTDQIDKLHASNEINTNLTKSGTREEDYRYNMDTYSNLPFFTAINYNKQLDGHLSGNRLNGGSDVHMSDTSSRPTSNDDEERQITIPTNGEDSSRNSSIHKSSYNCAERTQENRNVSDFSDLIKRLSKLYHDPKGKVSIDIETLKQKFMEQIASDDMAVFGSNHNLKELNNFKSTKSPVVSNSPSSLPNNTFNTVSKRKAKNPLRLGSKQICIPSVISTSFS